MKATHMHSRVAADVLPIATAETHREAMYLVHQPGRTKVTTNGGGSIVSPNRTYLPFPKLPSSERVDRASFRRRSIVRNGPVRSGSPYSAARPTNGSAQRVKAAQSALPPVHPGKRARRTADDARLPPGPTLR